ncbi:fatty acid cis/trans isomerase [Methylococcus sp. EFPC2]|uniref:fatty acid cis/trans isomerase n=1 Tax=Methylococcus sp. EFPC2 TaxID=2812648 RepID=UPI00196809D7|nr:fatty acid cis/trans isomerase [Methylococcus sp. EFPC2]QSA97843.1 fatty acid cis/trans isomerase [Methylococcus sp. EFPC2]
MRMLLALVLVVLVAGCATYGRYQWDQRYGPANSERFDRLQRLAAAVDYRRDVKPILDNRCVVCHACYDAPCQLQLGSYEGITRGGHKDKVYDALRLLAVEPTRIFLDARTNAEWRDRGFHPVLNERRQTPEANREVGVLARLLTLKRRLDFPYSGLLPQERYDFSLDREQQCTAIEEIDRFESEHPEWGMPYGLPPLTGQEHQTVMQWLEAGAPASPAPALTPEQNAHVAEWEALLNGADLKTQLMSRYIYEHWFLAHLYFDDLPLGDYFELVRSRTPPGQPIDLIATRRPFDDPGAARVYYRLRPHASTLVAKTHMPYALNAARMARIKGWFLDEPYAVTSLPSYDPKIAANPFIAFEQLPVNARYRLMLDEAQFTVMGFIKGPVCRGQVALNVVTDHFWIAFVHPDVPLFNENADFLASVLRNVNLPVEQASNARLIKWLSYSREETDYLHRKSELLNQRFRGDDGPRLSMLWDGDGVNRNAALTVFRHFDSASVVQGLVGDRPQTALVIGYALLERIHYLLVAGFDVYGNTAHQLEARLYMDFLRMEGEMNFLSLLPKDDRNAVRDQWYRGASDDVKAYLNGSKTYFAGNTGVHYQTGDSLTELYGQWKGYMAPVLDHRYDLSAEGPDDTSFALLNKLAALRGRAVSHFPESSFLTVRGADGRDRNYTLIRNSAHSNVSELLSEDKRLLPDEDTLLVARGFIGAYPNALYRVPSHRLAAFVKLAGNIRSDQDYAALAERFAIRRTDPRFWAHSDAVYEAFRQAEPVEAALFDYNRLENR